MKSDQFIELNAGNDFFRKTNKSFPQLAEKQEPEFVVIACSDSRVSPYVVLNARLGSIFEIRTAGGVLDETAIASVEFALKVLGSRKILFIAHTKCGAVTAAFDLLSAPGQAGANQDRTFLSKFTSELSKELLDHYAKWRNLDACISQNAINQVKKLFKSELVKTLARKNELDLAIGLYDLGTGSIEISVLQLQSFSEENGDLESTGTDY